MTRDEWIDKCADRYIEAGGLGSETALYFAAECANQQASINSVDAEDWNKPSDAADEDMSYWENDE